MHSIKLPVLYQQVGKIMKLCYLSVVRSMEGGYPLHERISIHLFGNFVGSLTYFSTDQESASTSTADSEVGAINVNVHVLKVHET